jgi:hypothetical protein
VTNDKATGEDILILPLFFLYEVIQMFCCGFDRNTFNDSPV